MRQIVCDTGPLIHLFEANLLAILWVSPRVLSEARRALVELFA